MGCGQSKAAAAVHYVDGNHQGANLKSLSESTKKVSEDSLQIPIPPPPSLNRAGSGRSKEWLVRPGYSSGASSYEGSDGVESERVESKGSGLDRSRHSSTPGLGSLRQDLAVNGDLCQQVVRIETPFGRPIEEIYDGVHDGPVLGSGVSGIVRLVQHRATGLKYAVKILDLGLIDSTEGLRQLRDEIFIMCQLDHPNIVRIEEVYESTSDIYIVQELCYGGDLFDRLDEQPDYHYTEAQCARLVKQMLSSVRYLHSKGIIHRDLKLENFLFSSTSPTSDLKMIDFGLSKHFELGQFHTEKVGTPYTVAPEIIRGTYDEKSDIWSLGVITYLLLCGETPFGGLDGENLLLVKQNIIRAQLRFEPTDVWSGVSRDARDFVRLLLNPDPKKRPTAREAQLDKWIQVWSKKNTTEGSLLSSKTVNALMKFKEASDMQKLLSEVLSFTLLPEQIVELKGEFEKIDDDGDGEITLSALKRILLESAQEGSLGALTEQEVEDIFDAIRVRKAEPTIRWHEFLAAGLSQAKVDDRNLRLAFDRLDTDRKGFITFDDLQGLLGGSTEHESLEKIWCESLAECKAHLDSITFENFKRLMKGQSKDRRPSKGVDMMRMSVSLEKQLEVVPETEKIAVSAHPDLERVYDGSDEMDVQRTAYVAKRSRSFEQKASVWGEASLASIEFPTTPQLYAAVSVPPPVLKQDASRAIILPGQADKEYEDVIRDENMSPLLVNRALYRKHREMRFAVLEASKQFDKKRNDIRNNKLSKAGLIMKRGVQPPVELEDAHRRALFEAAAKRCGRARRSRNKTVSDVTGMMLKAQA